MTDWSSFYDMSTFSFKIAAPDGTMVDLSVSFRGEPRTGAIGTLESVGAVIEVRTTGDAGPTRYWYATKECCGGPPDYGHFTLTLTRVSSPVKTSSGKLYQSEGTLDATLVTLSYPPDGSSLTMQASF